MPSRACLSPSCARFANNGHSWRNCDDPAAIDLTIAHSASVTQTITISAGVAANAPSETQAQAGSLVRDADRALYRAKHLGRNTVVCASALAEMRDDVHSTAA